MVCSRSELYLSATTARTAQNENSMYAEDINQPMTGTGTFLHSRECYLLLPRSTRVRSPWHRALVGFRQRGYAGSACIVQGLLIGWDGRNGALWSGASSLALSLSSTVKALISHGTDRWMLSGRIQVRKPVSQSVTCFRPSVRPN